MFTVDRPSWDEPRSTTHGKRRAVRYKIPVGAALTLSLFQVLAFDLVEFGSGKATTSHVAMALALSGVAAIAVSALLSYRYRRYEIAVISCIFTALPLTYFCFDTPDVLHAAPSRHFLLLNATFQFFTFLACRTPGTPTKVARYTVDMFILGTPVATVDDLLRDEGYYVRRDLDGPRLYSRYAVADPRAPLSKASRLALYVVGTCILIVTFTFHWGFLFFEILEIHSVFAPQTPYLFSGMSLAAAVLLLVAALPAKHDHRVRRHAENEI